MTQYRWRSIQCAFPTRLLNAFLVLLLCSSFQSIHAAETPIVGLRLGYADYVALPELAQKIGGHIYKTPHNHKTVLKVGRHTCVFTSLSSVLTINDEAYRLPMPTRYYAGALVVSSEFLTLFSRISGHPLQASINAKTPQPEPSARTVAPIPIEKAMPPRYAPEPSPVLQSSKPAIDVAKRSANWTLKTIIIDPGHGGKDPGAIGPGGTYEKTIALEVAKRLQKLLEKELKVDVILTRDDDTFIPLHKRSQIALQKGGKIFISLHCNATKNQKAQGFEVYFLSEAKTQAAAEVARLENAVLEKYEGISADTLSEGVNRIRYGLLSNQFLKESQELAAAIHNELPHQMPQSQQRGVKQANFFVMRNTMAQMPSVLVEMGFITNKDEEKDLRNRTHQEKLAHVLYRGIQTFKERYEQQLSADQ